MTSVLTILHLKLQGQEPNGGPWGESLKGFSSDKPAARRASHSELKDFNLTRAAMRSLLSSCGWQSLMLQTGKRPQPRRQAPHANRTRSSLGPAARCLPHHGPPPAVRAQSFRMRRMTPDSRPEKHLRAFLTPFPSPFMGCLP